MKIILEFSSYAEMRSFCESTLGGAPAADRSARADVPQTNASAVQGPQATMALAQGQAATQAQAKQTARSVDTAPVDTEVKYGPANFRTMKTLRQVVSALSGSTESAATIVEACVALKKHGECPPLTVISDDQLEDRVIATCEAMGIPLGT